MFPLAATWHDVLDGVLPFLLVVVLPPLILWAGAFLPPILYMRGRRRLALLLNIAGLCLFVWLGAGITAFLFWLIFYIQSESLLHMLLYGCMALALFAAVEGLSILRLRRRKR